MDLESNPIYKRTLKKSPSLKVFIIYARYRYKVGWYLKQIEVLINNTVCTTEGTT